jgi:hypothetical protein
MRQFDENFLFAGCLMARLGSAAGAVKELLINLKVYFAYTFAYPSKKLQA